MSADAPDLRVARLAEGLWRWELPDLEGRAGCQAGRHVEDGGAGLPAGRTPIGGGTYLEPAPGSADPLILVDPLLPEPRTAEAAKFWAALDGDVARLALPLLVVLSCPERTSAAHVLARRYGARTPVSAWLPATERAPRALAGEALAAPAGLVVEGSGDGLVLRLASHGETRAVHHAPGAAEPGATWLPAHGAVLPGTA